MPRSCNGFYHRALLERPGLSQEEEENRQNLLTKVPTGHPAPINEGGYLRRPNHLEENPIPSAKTYFYPRREKCDSEINLLLAE